MRRAKFAAAGVAVFAAVLVAGCATERTEFHPLPDGGMEIETTGQLAAKFEREGVTAEIDSRKPSVLRNLIEFIGLKAAGTELRAGS